MSGNNLAIDCGNNRKRLEEQQSECKKAVKYLLTELKIEPK